MMVRVSEILTFARIKTLAIERATVRIDRVGWAATSRVHQRVGGWLTKERRSPPRSTSSDNSTIPRDAAPDPAENQHGLSGFWEHDKNNPHV